MCEFVQRSIYFSKHFLQKINRYLAAFECVHFASTDDEKYGCKSLMETVSRFSIAVDKIIIIIRFVRWQNVFVITGTSILHMRNN